MDLSCIISSGDLELYVLGMLPADEAEKITKLAELFPEIEEEINRITSTLVGTADAAEHGPSPARRSKVLSQLSALEAPEEKKSETPVIAIPGNKKVSDFPWLAAASVAALVFAAAFIFSYQQKLAADAESRQLSAKLGSYEKAIAEKEAEARNSQAMLNMFRSGDYRKIELKQLPGAQPAQVMLFWNSRTNEVFMGEMKLPQPPAGKQYQLWAIVNGKPVDAGMIMGTEMQKMKTFEKAEAFAITLEKQGGSPTPTMEAMVVIANT